jgi:hypothetical protein
MRGLAALALLAICGIASFGGPLPGKPDPPKPLPKEIVEAWERGGMSSGWMPVGDGFLQYSARKKGVLGDLLAFDFPWREGVLPKLPAPQAGFGLSLSVSEAPDACMKELAGLKSLLALGLVGTKVKDAGVAELREALPGCVIFP